MDRDKQPLTAQEKIEMDIMAEAELGKLQRQYRIMEGDRKAFSEETNTKLAKQRRVISALKKEQNELLTNLKVATSEANKRKDRKASANVNHMLDDHENYTSMINKEKSRLNEVNKQIQKLEKRITQLRRNDVTDAQFASKIKTAERSVQGLENHLDNEIKRFCSVLEENRKLREKIEHLLKERKKLMLDLIEQATVAYDQREEWCSKLHALRIRSRNDLMLHAEEMKELQRQLDHDSKLYEFLGVKGQKRIMKDLEEKELKKVDDNKEEFLRQQDKYEAMLREIKDLVNEEDVTRLGAQYFKQEEENFALFNYVNELNHEIEVLNLEIDQLQSSIGTANRAQEQLEESEQNLEQLLSGIKKMFELIGCDHTPVLQLLGNDAEINDNNVMLYLGVLEQKVGELTANMYLKEKNLVKT
ncbi:hypothetical protein RN001_010740 [Aquatica leii]|uniref:ODAD1 central coiled coil region domain-containing protein n=1 Tax=Aquatica leii TaxID=1421715 RepID=A0AAN7SG76_9COLE|nr:hypothetical protein RN001_010740 [Aquatica leii]